jgi:hypothetical protein
VVPHHRQIQVEKQVISYQFGFTTEAQRHGENKARWVRVLPENALALGFGHREDRDH